MRFLLFYVSFIPNPKNHFWGTIPKCLWKNELQLLSTLLNGQGKAIKKNIKIELSIHGTLLYNTFEYFKWAPYMELFVPL